MKNNNEMVNKSIFTVYMKLSFPIIFGMSIQGLYGLFDAIFITRYIGTYAMAGFSIFFPILLIISAIGVMFGTGTAVLVSRHLGASNNGDANQVAIISLISGLIISLFFTLVGLINLDSILYALGATEDIISYAYDYAYPLILCMPILIITIIAGDLLRAEGKTKQMFAIMLIASVANIVFDALFIVVLKMGIGGAAIATIVANLIALIWAFLLFRSHHTAINLSLINFNFKISIVISVLILGIPTLISNLSYGAIIFLVNFIIKESGLDNAGSLLSAYGIIFRILSFLILPLIAMMAALQTLSSYNFGAGKYLRSLSALKVACLVSCIYSIILTLSMFLSFDLVFKIFTDDPSLIKETTDIASSIFIGLAFLGLTLIFIGFFQSIGEVKYATFIVLSKLFVQLALLWFIYKMFGVENMALSFVITDISVFILSLIYLRNKINKWRRNTDIFLENENRNVAL
ncbi:MATE family efflux transporter [Xenorhabdus bovienii]|uniref:MATE family efflux transporter n=1 Tax=Xenorhabdus bovienii TaxID=40576 RepID=UPI001EDD2998|nr:MATE family efflux transporter [Xenorhabdus bovienii]MCG3463225.1 MATE family efflux transporter [Xenorhabdus bovienii]